MKTFILLFCLVSFIKLERDEEGLELLLLFSDKTKFNFKQNQVKLKVIYKDVEPVAWHSFIEKQESTEKPVSKSDQAIITKIKQEPMSKSKNFSSAKASKKKPISANILNQRSHNKSTQKQIFGNLSNKGPIISANASKQGPLSVNLTRNLDKTGAKALSESTPSRIFEPFIIQGSFFIR
jgi:hypothetical protein